jgi:hypothetical protein
VLVLDLSAVDLTTGPDYLPSAGNFMRRRAIATPDDAVRTATRLDGHVAVEPYKTHQRAQHILQPIDFDPRHDIEAHLNHGRFDQLRRSLCLVGFELPDSPA